MSRKLNYLKLADVKPGDRIRCEFNTGHDHCLPDGAIRDVKQNQKGELYVGCADGEHLIAGQVDNPDGIMIGVFAT